jgi:hypothetical protein
MPVMVAQHSLDSSVVLPQLACTITEVLPSITQYYLDICVVLPQLVYTMTDVFLTIAHYYLNDALIASIGR